MPDPSPATITDGLRQVRAWLRSNPLTLTFLLICVGVFLVAQLTHPENVRFLAFDHAELPERWYATVTYGFVHVDWNHIIVNVLVLIWIGVWVERLIGPPRFALLVLTAIAVGGLSLLVRGTAGIGFSAATAALLAYYHFAFPWERELPLRIPNILLPVMLIAGSVGGRLRLAPCDRPRSALGRRSGRCGVPRRLLPDPQTVGRRATPVPNGELAATSAGRLVSAHVGRPRRVRMLDGE